MEEIFEMEVEGSTYKITDQTALHKVTKTRVSVLSSSWVAEANFNKTFAYTVPFNHSVSSAVFVQAADNESLSIIREAGVVSVDIDNSATGFVLRADSIPADFAIDICEVKIPE